MSRLLTRKEFSKSVIDLIGPMAEMNYSQDVIEATLGMLTLNHRK